MPVTISGTNGITFNDSTTQSTAATAPTTAQVLNATAAAALGEVGTYAWLGTPTSTTITAGTTWAGSSLRYAGTLSTAMYSDNTAAAVSSVSPSGTWMAMGQATNSTRIATTTFLRIS